MESWMCILSFELSLHCLAFYTWANPGYALFCPTSIQRCALRTAHDVACASGVLLLANGHHVDACYYWLVHLLKTLGFHRAAVSLMNSYALDFPCVCRCFLLIYLHLEVWWLSSTVWGLDIVVMVYMYHGLFVPVPYYFYHLISVTYLRVWNGNPLELFFLFRIVLIFLGLLWCQMNFSIFLLSSSMAVRNVMGISIEIALSL